MISLEAYRAVIGSFLNRAKYIQYSRSSRNADVDVDNFQQFSDDPFFLPYFIQTFGMFLLILLMYCNYSLAVFKLLKLLIDGDVESNPGPHHDKSVLGTFHQGDLKYGDTAGVQCMCNALFSLCWAKVKKVSLWKSFDLDYVLDRGDEVYKQLNKKGFLLILDLPSVVAVEEHPFHVNMIHNETGFLSQNNTGFISASCNSLLDTGTGILFLINGFTFSIIWGKSTFNVFDSHSRDFEGFTSPNGTSVLLQFRSVHAVEKYILDAYISNANNIVQYEMQYVNIDTGEIEVNSLLRLYNKRRSQHRVGKCRSAIAGSSKYEENKVKKKLSMRDYRSSISGTEMHEVIKKRKKLDSHILRLNMIGSEEHEQIKNKNKQNMRDYRSHIFGTEKYEQIKNQNKQNMRDYRSQINGSELQDIEKEQQKQRKQIFRANIAGSEQYKKMKEQKRKYMQNNRAFCKIDSESDRADSGNRFEGNIARFTEKIRKGPVFICVVCNRCLYDRSVMIFNENSYEIGDPYFSYSFVHSFDGKLYICLTCHRKLKRHIIPDISVFNKLSLSEFLKQLNRLKSSLLTKRICLTIHSQLCLKDLHI